MVDVVGDHRADDADVVDAGGNLRKQFADLDAALAVLLELERRLQQVARFGTDEFRHLERQRFAVEGGEFRLGVEGIDVRRPAGHEQEDETLGLRGILRGSLRQRIVGGSGAGLVGKQAGEPEQAEAVGEAQQHLAAAENAGGTKRRILNHRGITPRERSVTRCARPGLLGSSNRIGKAPTVCPPERRRRRIFRLGNHRPRPSTAVVILPLSIRSDRPVCHGR